MTYTAAAEFGGSRDYVVTVFQNFGEGFAWKYDRSDALRDVSVILKIRATSIDEALDVAWVVGNREYATDQCSDRWPVNVRSLSCGDVLAVAEIGQSTLPRTRWYAIDSFGFTEVDSLDVAQSLRNAPSPRFEGRIA